jgi:hypothetical protein
MKLRLHNVLAGRDEAAVADPLLEMLYLPHCGQGDCTERFNIVRITDSTTIVKRGRLVGSWGIHAANYRPEPGTLLGPP